VDRKPVAALVIPDDALPVVREAAGELQYHVRRATDAELPIVPESQRPAGTLCVFLGPCAATKALDVDLATLPPNGYVIRNAPGALHLAGDDSPGDVFWIQHGNRTRVGTLFAVYELLETQLGVRWLWPGPLGEAIPAAASLRLEVADQVGKPSFIHTRWRDGGIYMAGTKGWAVSENRSRFLNEQGKWLRRHRFAMGINMDMTHSFTTWWERFGKDHPEYFNLLPDGTRRPDPLYEGGHPSLVAMCVAQPAVWQQKVAEWAEKRSPAAPYLDASENDTPGLCVCPLCLALDVQDPASTAPFASRAEAARQAYAEGRKDWYQALGSLSDRYARFYLALQQQAETVDPRAVVMGYAYANYVKPPLETRLNERVIVGIVPGLMFPWTPAKRQAFREQWDGWSAAGARLLLRPNYMLDGHCFPINVARALGEDFSYAAQHGLIGTDFDSLTGQYGTQGPALYVLARLHDAPAMAPEQCLDEYFAAFGPAAAAVRAYFDHWEAVSGGITEDAYAAADLHWSRLYRDADTFFTAEAMVRGRELLQAAEEAAVGEATATARVAFLAKGLRNAELTLAAARAYREYRQTGTLDPYVTALEALDTFRATIEPEFVANMAYLAWAESHDWDRDLIRLMAQPGTRLPDPWKFAWDPDGQGEARQWYAPGLDTVAWIDIATTGPWEQQEPGRRWKAEHRADYNGVAWYRTAFTLPEPGVPGRWRLIFGAVDEACRIWLNGQLLLERPYPYRGNTESWRESFELDITDAVLVGQPNVLAVRVEDNAGAGGIWKPVWLTRVEAPAAADANRIPDGGFEAEPSPWRPHVQGGRFAWSLATTQRHGGRSSALLQCTELAPPEVQERIRGKAWGRWYQTGISLDPAKTYRFRVWYRTDLDFAGTVKAWVTGTEKETTEVKGLNTVGVWRELSLDGVRVPAGSQVGVYLNLMDGLGTVWFDEAELTEVGQRSDGGKAPDR
jgi:hypothetical protein